MSIDRFKFLYQSYLAGTCTDAERAELMTWLGDEHPSEEVTRLVDATWEQLQESDLKDLSEVRADVIFDQIVAEKPNAKWHRRWISRVAAVIVFVSLSVGGAVYFSSKPAVQMKQQAAIQSEPIRPGGNNAVLTLADGRSIALNDAAKGELAKQENVAIRKIGDGQLVYAADGSKTSNQTVLYNTISTPRGGQYTIVLPDGSKAWLNAGSSLKYPVSFNGKARKVEMTGEVYFEVARNTSQPFIVSVNAMEVKVLGTHFNIMAYGDERDVVTTLLEGSVKVSGQAGAVTLKPGQKSQYDKERHALNVSAGNTEAAVAWKNGYFMFQNENIQTIMRTLSRWYDVDVEYEGAVIDKKFGGTISKYENISEVLKTMELTGTIHFEIKERRIIVKD